jgi:hypothetical protein
MPYTKTAHDQLPPTAKFSADLANPLDVAPGSLWLPADGSPYLIHVDKVEPWGTKPHEKEIHYHVLGTQDKFSKEVWPFQVRYSPLAPEQDIKKLGDETFGILRDKPAAERIKLLQGIAQAEKGHLATMATMLILAEKAYQPKPQGLDI